MLRPDAVSEAPLLRSNPPELLRVVEGGVAEMRVEATVRGAAHCTSCVRLAPPPLCCSEG